jgi:phage baseplate assembly protein W
MQPDFGCDLRSLLFENISDDLLPKIEDTIRSSFDYWLPYIFINELTITTDPDRNRVFITMRISLEGNKFDTRSIQVEVINNAA